VVVRAPATAAYVLADEPVTVYEVEEGHACRSSAPLASVTAEMVVPLDPRFALVLSPNAEVLAGAARDNGRALREITGEEIAAQINRPVVWEERDATAEQIREMNLRSYAHAQNWMYGETQAALTDLRHLARGRSDNGSRDSAPAIRASPSFIRGRGSQGAYGRCPSGHLGRRGRAEGDRT